MTPIEQTVAAIEKYGQRNMIVSVAYGPCGQYGNQYSVTVTDLRTGKEFDTPFGARTFGDIAMILDIEVPKLLGEEWLNTPRV